MTDYQYQSILKSIKMIVSGCRSVEEVEEKLDELLQKDSATDRKKEKKKGKK